MATLNQRLHDAAVRTTLYIFPDRRVRNIYATLHLTAAVCTVVAFTLLHSRFVANGNKNHRLFESCFAPNFRDLNDADIIRITVNTFLEQDIEEERDEAMQYYYTDEKEEWDGTYEYIFAREYGMLYLSNSTVQKYEIPVVNVTLWGNDTKCIGSSITQGILSELIGYDTLVLQICTFLTRSHGYLMVSDTSEVFSFYVDKVSFVDRWISRIETLLECLFLLFMTSFVTVIMTRLLFSFLVETILMAQRFPARNVRNGYFFLFQSISRTLGVFPIFMGLVLTLSEVYPSPEVGVISFVIQWCAHIAKLILFREQRSAMLFRMITYFLLLYLNLYSSLCPLAFTTTVSLVLGFVVYSLCWWVWLKIEIPEALVRMSNPSPPGAVPPRPEAPLRHVVPEAEQVDPPNPQQMDASNAEMENEEGNEVGNEDGNEDGNGDVNGELRRRR